ncbi:Lactosylceramide 4-alpha-galactosyltransferase [Hondaea fermentalgiana]|uniref:Lactosylceramide 4-alpha-galactosyltransferase n=1 Tax=Hondaea fermentalgiana TaxID=2315210 RepID=A0A2R5GUY8_9STRA|nr:Lactosylceramide 4-alpha-galactosyltransferase [Hondaea fermentalgiana]|eukprot:GBG32473.1 Lactosylceramide 4-alpha-galactosyltransferase [Hondaea fermentalgiana]
MWPGLGPVALVLLLFQLVVSSDTGDKVALGDETLTPTSWAAVSKETTSTALLDVGPLQDAKLDASSWRCPFDEEEDGDGDGETASTTCEATREGKSFSRKQRGDVIFFVHTSHETGDAPSTARCAIESAARANPGARIRVVSGTWTSLGGLETELPKFHHLSDALRLALLYGCGGSYLDTDVISVRDLSEVQARAFVGLEQQADPLHGRAFSICNAVMRFQDRRRTFVRRLIEQFIESFDANGYFGSNGPQLLSRAWKTREGAEATLDTVHLLPERAFYVVPWHEVGSLFDDRVDLDARLAPQSSESFPVLGIHLWQSQVRGQLDHVGQDYRNAPIGKVFRRYCPRTFKSQWPGPHAEVTADFIIRIEHPTSGLQVYGADPISVRVNVEARNEAMRHLLERRAATSRLCLGLQGHQAACYPLTASALSVENPGPGFYTLEVRLCMTEGESEAPSPLSSSCLQITNDASASTVKNG